MLSIAIVGTYMLPFSLLNLVAIEGVNGLRLDTFHMLDHISVIWKQNTRFLLAETRSQ